MPKEGILGLPTNVETGMVTGRYIADIVDGIDPDQEPDVVPVQGRIVFTKSVAYLPNPTAEPYPVTIMQVPIVAVLDEDGILCTPFPGTLEPQYRGVRLIATDDPDLAVQNWTWDVTYMFDPIDGYKIAIPPHGFALPSGETVDLTKVAKVPSSPGYSLPQAEAAVLRAEEAALSSAQASADALAAAIRAEQAATATDQGIAEMLSDPQTQSGDLLAGLLDPKANVSDVELALSGKADHQEVESLIATKADLSETVDALALKADKTVVDGKADQAALAAGLSTKVDVTALAPKIAEQAVQSDYVAQLEAKSPHNAVQLVKVDTGEALQVVAHSATGAFTTHLIEGTAAGSGRDDYRIVGDIYAGKLPRAVKTYTDLTNTGTFVATAEQFAYTTLVGATITANVVIPFAGAEVRFYPYKDNRGGVWRFTLAGQITDVSTWAAAAAQESNGFLVSPPGIPKGTHVLKAEFLGDDPAHAPSSGAGTSRGWLARTPGTNQNPGQYDVLKYPDLSGGWAQGVKQGIESNREFAWWFKRAGTTQTAQWVPSHGVATAFNAEPTKFYDGDRELNIFRMAAGEALDLSGPFKMVQHVYGRNTAEPTVNLIDVWTTTTIHPSGRMTIEGRIKVNFDIEVTHPYVIMDPVNSAVFDTVVSPIGATYPNTAAQGGTNTWLAESDWGESWLFLSSSQGDQAAAFRYNNPVETTRRGGAGKPSEANKAWLEHRTGGTILKHYQKLWATGAIIPAGTVHRFSGDYVHAVIPNAFGELAKV